MRTDRIYHDRREAGRILAQHLSAYIGQPDTIVLGLPRGGVPVAREVAHALSVPLDIFVVRKIGLPSQPELAMGAIASGNVQVLNDDVIRRSAVTPEEIAEVAAIESAELKRRERLYRGGRPPLDLTGCTAILVDDGLATGASMRAATVAVRAHRPARVVVAVPVGAPDTCASLAELVDELICPLQPHFFAAVGHWYEDFSATTDEEVQACLAEEWEHAHSAAVPPKASRKS